MRMALFSLLLLIIVSSCSINRDERINKERAIEAYKLTHNTIVPIMENLLKQYKSSGNGGDSILEDLIISANNGTETYCGISRESNSRTFRYKVTYVFDNVDIASADYHSLNGQLTVVEDCLSPENMNCIEASFALSGSGEIRDILFHMEITESATIIEVNGKDMTRELKETVRSLASAYTKISRLVL